MASTRIVNEILLHKKELEKIIPKDEDAPLVEKERITDIIKALNETKMTVEVLSQTSIGKTLLEIKTRYPKEIFGIAAKKTIAKWRNDCTAGSTVEETKAKPTEKVETNKKEKSEATSPRGLSRMPSNDEEEWADEEFDKLPKARKHTVTILTDALKLSVSENIAKFISTNIEQAANKIQPYEKDNRAYIEKIRSLVFNLKENSKLRDSVCGNTIAIEKLVEMTSAELASDDIIKERIALSENLTKARRTDIYQLAAAEAQQTHGIDDGKGEFKCRKCKGTKTSHYAMQTRSSDEPMTVFVCCLSCGNRWRE